MGLPCTDPLYAVYYGTMENAILIPPVFPFQGFRGGDDFGEGHFGAHRRKDCPECQIGDPSCGECGGKGVLIYTHNGLDCIGKEHDTVVAPIGGRIVHSGIAYEGATLGSVHIANATFKVRLLYGRLSTLLSTGSSVLAGSTIGIVQNVAAYHAIKDRRAGRLNRRKMTNHIHMDFWVRKGGLWERIDPTPYLAHCGVA